MSLAWPAARRGQAAQYGAGREDAPGQARQPVGDLRRRAEEREDHVGGAVGVRVQQAAGWLLQLPAVGRLVERYAVAGLEAELARLWRAGVAGGHRRRGG